MSVPICVCLGEVFAFEKCLSLRVVCQMTVLEWGPFLRGPCCREVYVLEGCLSKKGEISASEMFPPLEVLPL